MSASDRTGRPGRPLRRPDRFSGTDTDRSSTACNVRWGIVISGLSPTWERGHPHEATEKAGHWPRGGSQSHSTAPSRTVERGPRDIRSRPNLSVDGTYRRAPVKLLI